MNLKKKVVNSVVLFLLGALLAGFLAGIGAYKAILEIAKLDVVREGEYIEREEVAADYVPKDRFELIEEQYQQLIDENRRLQQEISESQTNSSTQSTQIDKGTVVLKLEVLIRQGKTYLSPESHDQSFNYQEWKSRGQQILASTDKLLNSTYSDQFDKKTGHLPSQVFLDLPSVRDGLVILETVRDALKE